MLLLKRHALIFFSALMGVLITTGSQASAAPHLANDNPYPGAWRHFFYENRFFDPLVVNNTMWTNTDISVVRWDLADFSHLSYTRVDGLPDDRSRPLAVGPNGDIWFGSSVGLGRYNGKTWQVLTEVDGLASSAVSAIAFDADEHMWLSYGIAGAGYFDGSTWYHYTTADGLSHNHTNDIAIDGQGNVWLATYSGLNRFDGTTWHTYTTADGLLENFTWQVEIDADDHVWVVHSEGISEFDGIGWTTYTAHLYNVFDAFVDSSNQKWFGSLDGVVRYDGLSWQVIAPPEGWSSRVMGIAQSADGCYLFTTETGIYRNCASEWEHILLDSPLPSNNSGGALAIDSHGNRWFGFEQGITVFDGINWQTIADIGITYDLSIDLQDRVWAATQRGAYVYSGGQWTHYTTADGLADDAVYAVCADAWGRVWFGTLGGVSKYESGTWTTYTTAEGLAGNIVQAIIVDSSGIAWFGTTLGLSSFDGQNWQTYTTAQGLLDNEIYSLAMDADQNIWAGSAQGINVFDGQTWINYTTADGLPHWYIYAIAFDQSGRPWAGTGVGIAYMENEQWHPLYPFGSVHYGNTRGLAFDQAGNLWLADRSAGVFEFIPGAIEGLITPESGGQLGDNIQQVKVIQTSHDAGSYQDLFQVTLSFPPGTVATDLDLLYSPLSAADLSMLPNVIRSFELHGLTDGTSGPPVAQTKQTYQISIQYNPMAAVIFDESSFQLYSWQNNGWILEPTQALDTTSNNLGAAPTQLTHFVLVGEPKPDQIFIYLPMLLKP
jgi:hypothetical protein